MEQQVGLEKSIYLWKQWKIQESLWFIFWSLKSLHKFEPKFAKKNHFIFGYFYSNF